jgi:hypothetical protein
MGNYERLAGEPPRQDWRVGEIERVLGGIGEVTRDVAFGEGVTVDVGPEGRTRLEMYQDAGVTRVTTEDVRVELHRTVPVVTERGVVFSGTQDVQPSCAVIEPSGTMVLFVGVVPPAYRNLREGTERRGESANEPPAATEVGTIDEKAPRVVVTGRVGREITVRTTPRGHTIARMILGVHGGDDEKTGWHTVLFFDERAEKAVETIKRGQLLTVVGFKHVRQVPRRDGGTRLVEEIYATSVQAPK